MKIINEAATRKLILAKFDRLRPHLGIKRVSQESLDKINARVINMIVSEVQRHPSKGITFKL